MGWYDFAEEILQETREDGIYKPIQYILNPHRNDPYPSNHIGDFSRYPIEYRWKDGRGNGWISVSELQQAVGKLVPDILKLTHADAKKFFNELLNKRADSAYKSEWRDQERLGDIRTIISENPAAALSNKIISEKMTPRVIERLYGGAPFWLLDLGIGELGTTKRIIEAVPPEYKSKLYIVGVEVMEDARNKSSSMLINDYGMSPENVYMIAEMFGKLHKNREFLEYRKRFNGAVSGAAIHHQADVEPFFKVVYEAMADNSNLEIWDWLHWLWVAETVRVGENGNVPKEYINGLKQMAIVWTGLHGYGEAYRNETGNDLQAKVAKDFDSSIYTDGFNFHGWMKENLDGVEPHAQKRTAYKSAEGHRDPGIYKGVISKLFDSMSHYPIKDAIDADIPTAVLLHGFSAVKK